MRPVKVTAVLASELAGLPPQLDALLVNARAPMHKSTPHERHDAAPAMSFMPPTPLHREMLGPWLVHHCSSPIYDCTSDRHERIAQHFPRELSTHLHPSQQGTIATTNGAQKSMWLPIRQRAIWQVAWFAVVHDSPKELRRELRRSVVHLGQDRARGCGRVREWIVEAVDHDWSWYAPHPEGQVLMRQLPLGPWIPKDLCGFIRDFDAVAPPYWHPGRKTEIVRPC